MIYLSDFLIPSNARWQLPNSATSVQEYYDDELGGGFTRILKAKLPEEDYIEYAKALGLTARFDPSKHDDEMRRGIESYRVDEAQWWDPPPASETTFFGYVKGADCTAALSYSNGYVYYVANCWY